MSIAPDDLTTALRVLQAIANDPTQMDDHPQFKTLVAKIHKGAKREHRQERRAAGVAQLRQVQARTGVVQFQLGGATPLQIGQPADTSSVAQNCYVCKAAFHQLHQFYHLLCPSCASLNWSKREQRADLRGRIALVTGGRIKIGYQLALRMLRDGAQVIVTTRFPQDARQRFMGEPDSANWLDRLTLEGLDLRHIPSVEAFADALCQRLPHVDIVVNNAAQTIKRPLAFYAPLLANESAPWLLEASSNYRGQLAGYESYFAGNAQSSDQSACDVYGQPLDKRSHNSWALRLGDVSTLELLEVQVVNAIAPFVLTARLKPALLRSPHARRFVVQASAMEGQFGRTNKTAFHPHTNMAKAALNMLVRTSAQDWAEDGIYMNAVDTGWITDEKPYPRAQRARDTHHFYTPLDVVDGMARLYDPIACGLDPANVPVFGQFLKDYAPYAW